MPDEEDARFGGCGAGEEFARGEVGGGEEGEDGEERGEGCGVDLGAGGWELGWGRRDGSGFGVAAAAAAAAPEGHCVEERLASQWCSGCGVVWCGGAARFVVEITCERGPRHSIQGPAGPIGPINRRATSKAVNPPLPLRAEWVPSREGNRSHGH